MSAPVSALQQCTCGPTDRCSRCKPTLLESLREAPKDVTPPEQITTHEGRRIREQMKREANRFAKPWRAPQ